MKLIVCCGMPRSGSTLQFNIALKVLQGLEGFCNLGWVDDISEEQLKPGAFAVAIMKTHDIEAEPIQQLGAHCQLEFLYSFRDMRDVIASKLRKNNEIFSSGKVARWVESFLSADRRARNKSLYLAKYEEFSDNILLEVEHIARYLDVSVTRESLKGFAQDLSREAALASMDRVDKGYDPDSLIHRNHITSGGPGTWRDYFTRMQAGFIEYLCFDWLVSNGYPVRRNFFNSIFAAVLTRSYYAVKTLVSRTKRRFFPRRRLPLTLEKHPETVNSYSQFGEDLVLDALLGSKEKGFYIDVGANSPRRLNNTYRFYLRGWRGINIEPQPALYREFAGLRTNDINLNIGIAETPGALHFYELEANTLSTFDREAAMKNARRFKSSVRAEYDIPVYPLQTVLQVHLPPETEIDFLSIDTEGYDLRVLQSNDWKVYRPAAIVIETGERKIEIDQFLRKVGYSLIYLNGTNSIYFADGKGRP